MEADFLAYKAIKNKTNNLINEARKLFFKDFVDNSTDQRKLFSAIKRLFGRENVVPSYTRVSSPMMLTPRMRPFAQWKIALKI